MNLEHLLTEEHRQLRSTIREFTQKEIIPRTKELEADYSLVEKVHQKLVDMGIQAAGAQLHTAIQALGLYEYPISILMKVNVSDGS